MNINEILNKSKQSTQSLLNTHLGSKKESIYKETIFEGLNDKQKKSARKKIRNYVHAIFESIITKSNEKKTKELNDLITSFVDFYKETYKINDFSFSSLASENTKDKETINNALTIIKKQIANQNKKNNAIKDK